MQTRRIGSHNDPVRHWSFGHNARGEGDGGGGGGGKGGAAVFSDEEGRDEADQAGLVDFFDGDIGNFHEAERVARGEDDVVEFSDFLEKGFDVPVDGVEGGKIAYVAVQARFGRRVGGQEAIDRGGYTLRV